MALNSAKLALLLTYLLTPWCRVLLEKLTGLQLVNKFSAFHGTRRSITASTSVRHLSLSWASPIQSIYPHPTSWRSILILSTHLRLGLPPVSPARPYTPPLLAHTSHMPSPSHCSRFYHPHNIGWALYLQYFMCYVCISETLLNLCFIQRGDRLKVRVILIHK